MGGIVKPNDGKCHLDHTGLYTHSSVQDYPSISQINLKVKENAINVIFAVTADQISVYEQLKSHIEGATSGQLSDDSSNIVELVKEQYQVRNEFLPITLFDSLIIANIVFCGNETRSVESHQGELQIEMFGWLRSVEKYE